MLEIFGPRLMSVGEVCSGPVSVQDICLVSMSVEDIYAPIEVLGKGDDIVTK